MSVDNQKVAITIEGSLGESLKQAVASAKQLINELSGEAGNISVAGRFGGTSGNGNYGGRVRVSSTVAASSRPNAPAPNVRPMATFGEVASGWRPAQAALPQGWESSGPYNRSQLYQPPALDKTVMLTKPQLAQATDPYNVFENWNQPGSSRLGLSTRFGLAMAGHAAMQTAELLARAQTQSILTGRMDPMAMAGGYGSLVGGTFGAGLGLIAGGPFGMGLGASMGAGIGSTMGQMAVAPAVATDNFFRSVLPATGLIAGMNPNAGGWFSFGGGADIRTGGRSGRTYLTGVDYQTERLLRWAGGDDPSHGGGMARYITDRYFHGNTERGPSYQEMGEGARIMFSGLSASGYDPTRRMGTTSYYDRPLAGLGAHADEVIADASKKGGAGSLIRMLSAVSQKALANTMVPVEGDEDMMMMYTRRAAERYGKGHADVLKSLQPIFGTARALGATAESPGSANIAEVLLRHGPEAAQKFFDLQVEKGQKTPTDYAALLKHAGDLQANDRQRELASLSIRGSGSLSARSIERRMGILDGIPGGKETVEYSRSRRELASATMQGFEEEDLTGYSMDQMRFEHRGRRMDLLPFSPGNRYGYALEGIARNRRRIGQLRGREADLRSRGLLDERTEFALESNIEDLTTQSYAQIASLVDGSANRIPALSAGGIRGTTRWDSMQLAALNLNNMGHPGGRYGAISGGQARRTSRFFEQALGGPMPPGFGSAENSPLGSNNADTQAIVRLLERLVNATERGSNPQKPQRGPGELQPTGRTTIPGT